MHRKNLLFDWLVRAKTIENAHLKCSIHFLKRHYFWGGLLIASSTTSAALSVAAQNDSLVDMMVSPFILILRIILGIFVPIAAATITFQKFEFRSCKHHDAAAGYAGLKRQISILLANLDDNKAVNLEQEFEKISEKWDLLTKNMPSVTKSKTEWHKAIQETTVRFSDLKTAQKNQSANKQQTIRKRRKRPLETRFSGQPTLKMEA